MKTSLPYIKTKRKNGSDVFENAGENPVTLADFWSWAYSDLIGNTKRGASYENHTGMARGWWF